MKPTYLDSSVLIQAVQGVAGDKTAGLLEDPEREFVAATFLKLELLPQPTFHKRKTTLICDGDTSLVIFGQSARKRVC
jgi:hypothetical protein